MMNTVNAEHRDRFPNCRGNFTFNLGNEERGGLVWREQVTCSTCQYKSRMFSLYTEVARSKKRRGRKMATANLGLNIALTQTPIAGASLVRLLAGGNIEGPSRRGMMYTSKTARNVIIEENKSDMSKTLAAIAKIK